MSRAAMSLFVFGIYVAIVGVALIVVPSFFMSVLRLPPATVGWARIVGLLTVIIGAYDIVGSRAGCMPYIRASIPVRFFFAGSTLILVLTGQMPATIALLGATDIAGAIWTMLALRT